MSTDKKTNKDTKATNPNKTRKATKTKKITANTNLVRILLLLSDGFTSKESADLKLFFGHDSVILDRRDFENIKSSDDVINLSESCDIIITTTTLPPEILVELVNPKINTKPVIVSTDRGKNNISCEEQLSTEKLGERSVWAQVVLSNPTSNDQ